MNNKLETLLITKAMANQLAHLYLITPNLTDENNLSLNWLIEAITKIFTKHDPQTISLKNHTDFLMLKPHEGKNYNSDQIHEFFQFLKTDALSQKKKFVVISEGHKITELMANKLLKSLEEPPIALSVFIVNPVKAQMLSTIKSRAIQLPFFKSEEKEQSLEIIEHMDSFSEFSDFIQSKQLGNSELMTICAKIGFEYLRNQNDALRMIELIKKLEKESLYHNSANSLAIRIYDLLKDITNRPLTT